MARIDWPITPKCLGWLALAAMYGGLALCPSRGLAGQDQRAILALSINLIDKGETLVMLREADVLVRISDLEQAGLHGLAGTQETFGGESYISLTSLAPTITYELDEATLTLRLTVSPTLLPPTVLNLRTDRPPGIVYLQHPSAFVNYALNWSDVARVDAFGEAGISLGGTLLAGSVARTADGAFVRGYTSLTLDERERLRRWVLGDHFIGTGLLGGGAFLGGLSVSREFSLDPYLFRYPSLGVSGALLTPSTVDVYVNGILVRREPLPPGPFELRNLPVVAGSGVTHVVIRDAFGRGLTGSVLHQQAGNRASTAIRVQQSPPLGPGFGYRVEGQLGAQDRGSGVFRYQGDYGIYEASYGRFGEQDATTLSTFGSLVAIGGRVYPSRPVYDSFALIRVPGVAGVPGYLSNQEVGRTNRWGDLVVPDLLSYYGNRVGIGAADVPLEYAIDTTEQIIAPPYRGGALVTFPVHRTRRFTGTLVVKVAGRRVIPAYGQLTLTAEGQALVSPIGKSGEFYLENLTAGRYPATVAYQGGECQTVLDIPVTDAPFVNLGTLRCVVP